MRATIFLSALSILTAAPAGAQLEARKPIGSHIAVDPTRIKGAEAAQLQGRFAACAYRSDRALSDLILRNSDPLTIPFGTRGLPGRREAFRRLRLEHCLAGSGRPSSESLSARISNGRLRSMLAEQAYRHAHRDLAEPIASDAGYPMRDYVSQPAALPAAQALGTFGDCVVKRDAKAADAFIRTEQGRPEEATHARAMAPIFGGCLAQDQTLTFTPSSMRQIAAEALWHRFVGSEVLQ